MKVYEKVNKIYELLSGNVLFDWQKKHLKDFLENKKKSTNYVLFCPRRNGKTEIAIAIILYYSLLGKSVLFTSHREATSKKIYKRTLNYLKRVIPQIKTLESRINYQLPNGADVSFRTRSQGTAVGEYADVIIIDEAQEYQASHKADIEPIVATSDIAKILVIGTTPREESKAEVFFTLKEALENKKDKSVIGKIYGTRKYIYKPSKKYWGNLNVNPSYGKLLSDDYFVSMLRDVSLQDFNAEQLGYLSKQNIDVLLPKPYEFANLDHLIQKQPRYWANMSISIRLDIVNGYIAAAQTITESQQITDDDADVKKLFTEILYIGPQTAGVKYLAKIIGSLDPEAVIIEAPIMREEIQASLREYGTSVKRISFTTPTQFISSTQNLLQEIENNTLTFENEIIKKTIKDFWLRDIGRNGAKTFGSDNPQTEAVVSAIALSVMQTRLLEMR